MATLSELALKAHFEELKKQFSNKGRGSKKQGSPEEITDLISRAIKMSEDFYKNNPEAFTPNHKNDYQLMIRTINKYGNNYKGHPDLMEDAPIDKSFPDKKPMQKAGVAQNQKHKKRNAG